MPEFTIQPAGEDNMKDLSSVQRALMLALRDELLLSGKQLWVSFKPSDGTDPLQLYFCPLASQKIEGSMLIDREGDITHRTGHGHDFLK